ncbi:MAG: DUF4040 domain-containing protein [Desulfurococcaceae archaeon]
MINFELLLYAFMALISISSVIAVYLAIFEKKLVRAVVFSAIQSTLYAILYYLLMAPDIALVYIPVSVGLYPAVILILIRKTEGEEKV